MLHQTQSLVDLNDGLLGQQLKTDLGITYVPRWSIVPNGRTQSVAEHSWRTARIAIAIAGYLRTRGYQVDVLQIAHKALLHDVEEAVTGDMPRPTKPAESKVYASVEDWIVNLADKWEALIYIQVWGVGHKRNPVIEYMEDAVDEILESGMLKADRDGGYYTEEMVYSLADWLDAYTRGA